MTNVARVERNQELAAPADVSPMFAMIERAARDPSVDIDKLERLMQMKKDADALAARAAYDAAMADLQPALPSIGERGSAKVDGKTRYTYALWEDINAAIKPVLMAHGFALTFRTDTANGITVTGVLSHRAGHREETQITMPADPGGGKNAVQAVASSVSYGKRYTAGALLNLTSHGEDDDAYAAVSAPDNMSLDWIATAEAMDSLDAYKTRKAEVVKAYGDATRVPKSVLAAFNKRFAELKEPAK